MALYAALAARCAASVHAAELAAVLERSEEEGNPFYGDGKHMCSAGVRLAAELMDAMVADFGADAVVSDSCLCGVDDGEEDREGALFTSLCSVPAFPLWGASFRNGGFRSAVYRAWRNNPSLGTILVIVAGNDIYPGSSEWSPALGRRMDHLRNYWATGDVEVIYVDVVPSAWKCH